MFIMEGVMKKQTCVSSTTPSALGRNKDSQIISKVKPKIRIIHIFAPEIIKTDVENFRELVQRLTGKPTESSNNKKKPRIPRKEEARALCNNKSLMLTKKTEQQTGFCSTEFRERIKSEEEMWINGENENHGEFLGGFADLDGFMKELNEFPNLLPFDAFHKNAIGETAFL